MAAFVAQGIESETDHVGRVSDRPYSDGLKGSSHNRHIFYVHYSTESMLLSL